VVGAGVGVLTSMCRWDDGDMYVGEWYEGHQDGLGTYRYPHTRFVLPLLC
jgi:hypothetical protein